MTSIILVKNGSSSVQLEKALAEVQAVDGSTSYLLAETAAANQGSTIFISTKDTSLAAALRGAMDGADEHLFVMLDARLDINSTQIADFIRFAADRATDQFSYIALESDSESIDYEELSADSIVPLISSGIALPNMCVAFSAELANSCSASIAQSSSEYATEIAFKTVIAAAGTARYTNSAACPVPAESLRASSAERARLLRAVIEQTNIEELFPQHAWSAHQAESAAASYHSLAALFIKLGDASSAAECIKLSENFEDSPRALALKGIIAREKGEMLGAVANMVSSLQQYEERKKNDGKHYLTFVPQDLEVINTSLQNGLSALNQRDNKTALEHFSKAVFNFDSFYRDYGIAR